jgi:single-strand DNA-binding protein
MRSLNKVMLIGNLGTDPELRHTNSGQQVATFSLATNETWGGREGQERQERTEWHRIVVWGRLAEICNEYLRKGRQVYLEGRIQTRQWQDQQGGKRYTTEIVANNMMMLGGRGADTGDAPGGPMGPGSRSAPRPDSQRVAAPETADVPDAGGPDFFEDDSDLPF